MATCMVDTDTSKGLLLVYSECGPSINEADFNAWYDNEHIPPRLAIPGILSSSRYRAVDSQKPSWLALYELASLGVLQSTRYKALSTNASENEKHIKSQLSTLNSRVYSHIFSYTHGNTASSMLPAKYVFVVHMQVTLEGENEFNRWYNDEHMVLLSRVPGWLRGRRYKLVDSVHEGIKQEQLDDERKPFADYLAIHELERDGFLGLPEVQSALQTPWRERVMKTVANRELRLFEQYHVFKRFAMEQGSSGGGRRMDCRPCEGTR